MTKDPESEEVTKKTETIKIPKTEVTLLKGNSFKKTNNEEALSAAMGADKSPGEATSKSSAEPPNTEIQRKVIPVGTNSTPNTNSLMVLPLDTLAINIPTKGDQAIHQAQ